MGAIRKRYQAEEASFPNKRPSGFFGVYDPKKKGKRSLRDMVKGIDNPIEQATYALERVEKIEGQITKVLNAIEPEAKRLAVARRPSLARYLNPTR